MNYSPTMFSLIIRLILFSNVIFNFCHSCMSRSKITSFKVPKHQLQKIVPVPSANIEDKFSYVDDEPALATMIADLKDATELAVDTEYHSVRSYKGVTCLLQISTRTKDYVIDTIAIKKQLEVLNKLFKNPKIVKVLHDASNDAIWLQKDLNLYLVNVFDTFLAATVLQVPHRSYAYLLQHFCHVDIEKNKKYQAFYDWRYRPISKAAMSYARKDTHYLLWLYDIMRNELIDRANGSTELLLSVYNQSSYVCKEVYKETTAEDCYLNMIRKREKLKKSALDSQQLFALKSLCKWREKTARDLDLSVGYVMPGRILMMLIERLPDKIQDILEYCGPGRVPEVIRKNLYHLFQIIRKARHQPLQGTMNPMRSTRHSHEPTTKNKLEYSTMRKKQRSRMYVPAGYRDGH